MGRTGAINRKIMPQSPSELFATNARETNHGTLNSSYVAFRIVWVHLGPFCYCTKLDANGPIYCNYCKSLCHEVASELVTTNLFGCIWDRFVTALNSVQMGQSCAINAKVRVTMSRLNLSLRTCPIQTIGP